MNNIIGNKYSPSDRRETWLAMLAFRQGARDLRANPLTRDISIADELRYRRFLTEFIS